MTIVVWLYSFDGGCSLWSQGCCVNERGRRILEDGQEKNGSDVSEPCSPMVPFNHFTMLNKQGVTVDRSSKHTEEKNQDKTKSEDQIEGAVGPLASSLATMVLADQSKIESITIKENNNQLGKVEAIQESKLNQGLTIQIVFGDMDILCNP